MIATSLAKNDADLLVVTENGYGKRTRIEEYPLKGRGGLGVKTVQLTEARGQLAGALVVRDGFQVMLISNGGTVIKIPVEDEAARALDAGRHRHAAARRRAGLDARPGRRADGRRRGGRARRGGDRGRRNSRAGPGGEVDEIEVVEGPPDPGDEL